MRGKNPRIFAKDQQPRDRAASALEVSICPPETACIRARGRPWGPQRGSSTSTTSCRRFVRARERNVVEWKVGIPRRVVETGKDREGMNQPAWERVRKKEREEREREREKEGLKWRWWPCSGIVGRGYLGKSRSRKVKQ